MRVRREEGTNTLNSTYVNRRDCVFAPTDREGRGVNTAVRCKWGLIGTSPCLQPSSPTVWYRDTRSNGALSWLDANAFATSRRDSRMPLHRHRVPSIVSSFGMPKFQLHEISAISLQLDMGLFPSQALPLLTLDYRQFWSNMVRRIHQR